MGNFFLLLGGSVPYAAHGQLFAAGVRNFWLAKQASPSCMERLGSIQAASFARQNGSGSELHVDAQSRDAVLAAGLWFHIHGYSSGHEAQLLERYRKVGPEQLARELEGFFTLAIIDSARDEVIVITDLIGSCHAFMRCLSGVTAISSSSLVLASLGSATLDSVACQEFLCTGNIYEDRTLHREVRKLAPATVYRFAAGRLQSQATYWRIADIAGESLDDEDAVTTLGASIGEVASRIGKTFRAPVCDLTGGYDSRALVAGFRIAGIPFAVTVSGPDDSADVRISRQLAQVMGIRHIHQQAPSMADYAALGRALALTDGEYDTLEYSRIAHVHRHLAQQFDISLNGSFGEVARGYWWELLFPHTGDRRPLDAQLLARSRFAHPAGGSSLFRKELRISLAEHFTAVVERTNTDLSQLPNTLQMDNAYLHMRMQRWQGRIASSTNQIWPCLSPFMFRSVLETMLRARPQLRRRSLLIRKLLMRFQPHLALHPLEHGYPAVPATWRNLHRFAPLVLYYGGKFKSRLERQFAAIPSGSIPNSAHALRSQLWREDAVGAMLEPRSMHLAEIMDSERLGHFLQQSRSPSFAWHDQWARLLTAESALRAAARCRASVDSLQAN